MQNIFKFCPRCRKKLRHLSERLLDCPFCGFHFYLNPSLTNAVIFENKKKELLLVKRKVDPGAGLWDLPGGFVEYDESGEQSAYREIKEELGITINHLQYFCSIPDLYPFREITYHTLCLFYTAKLSPQQEKKLKASDDITDFKFFKKKELPYEKIAFKGIIKALQLYTQ